jgi:hypothetical protein
MKKKALVFIATLALLLAGSTAYISAQHDIISQVGDDIGGGGSTECNLCKVKNSSGKVKYSCRATPGTNCCSTSHLGHTLSCDNATKC